MTRQTLATREDAAPDQAALRQRRLVGARLPPGRVAARRRARRRSRRSCASGRSTRTRSCCWSARRCRPTCRRRCRSTAADYGRPARRPALRPADAPARRARLGAAAARGQRQHRRCAGGVLPRISLTANFGTASSELSGLFKSGSFAFTGTAQLLQPSSTPAATGQPRRRHVNRDIAVAQYETDPDRLSRSRRRARRPGHAGEQLRAQAAQTNALAITYSSPTCAIAPAPRAISTRSTRSARCSPPSRRWCRRRPCSCRTWSRSTARSAVAGTRAEVPAASNPALPPPR